MKSYDAFAESDGQPVRAENISVNLQKLRAVNLDGEADLLNGGGPRVRPALVTFMLATTVALLFAC